MPVNRDERERADSLQKKLYALINQLNELYFKRINAGYELTRDSQIRDLESKIKAVYKELINTYEDIAEKTKDKKTLLELAKLFSLRLNERYYYYLDPEKKEMKENKK